MAYQSEAALEQQFIEQLNKQEYTTVAIPDYDALVENFKVQFEAFNAPKLDTPITDKEWERTLLLVSRWKTDRHGKEYVILYANSVMSCSAVTGHIHIPMPRRRLEIPFKERRINLFLSSKAKVQR